MLNMPYPARPAAGRSWRCALKTSDFHGVWDRTLIHPVIIFTGTFTGCTRALTDLRLLNCAVRAAEVRPSLSGNLRLGRVLWRQGEARCIEALATEQ